MGRIIVLTVAVAVFALMSVIANRRLGHLATLPMQWTLAGQPTWSAPRRIALSFIPALGAIVLLAMAFAADGGAGLAAGVAAAFVAVHAVYLAMLFRTLKR